MKRVFAFAARGCLSTSGHSPRPIRGRCRPSCRRRGRRRRATCSSRRSRSRASTTAARRRAWPSCSPTSSAPPAFPTPTSTSCPTRRLPGDKTAALIVRWRSPHATKKPMLILGHMDVVEAKREDWKFDPFVFREEGGYFLGRGTQRHEERRRRDDHGRGQADERRVQARPRHHLLLQRRRGNARASARRSARPSGAT